MRHVHLTEFTPTPGDERAHRRRFADLKVILQGATGNKYAARLENLSEHGCMIALDLGDRIKRERLVGLRLDEAHYVVGRVVWTRDNIIGLSFLAPLTSAAVQQVSISSLSGRLACAKLSTDVIEDLPHAPRKALRLVR